MKKLLIVMLLFASTLSAKGLPDFVQLAKQTGGAVVNIKASDLAENNATQPNSRQQEQLFRFFGIPGQPQNRDRVSGGSGFIISADGYILTNRHVIADADKIMVTLMDRRELEAKLIGEDEATDVAVLKVEANNLPKLKIGSADQLEIGEWVMAIGSPLSFENSVTKGIISAKGRRLPGQNYIPYLQSDVPINRGNSGGPLINMDGEVVGINTLIYSNTGGYMGLSFSIPIEVAMNVADQLKRNQSVQRGLLGVAIENVSQNMADYLKMDRPYGALVNDVVEDSAAAKAGIEVGDVIVAFNGKAIVTADALAPVVGMTKPNSKVEVKLFRSGKFKTITASLDALDDDVVASNGSESKRLFGKGLGFKVSNLSEQDRQRSGEQHGVVVQSIQDKNVERAGLRVGMLIKKVGKQKIDNLKAFKAAVKGLDKGEPLVLLVSQGVANRFIVIER